MSFIYKILLSSEKVSRSVMELYNNEVKYNTLL